MQPYAYVRLAENGEDGYGIDNLLASVVLGNLYSQMGPVQAVQEAEKTVSEFIKARKRLREEAGKKD